MTENNTTPRTLEVRCCCYPDKLLGHITLPEHCCWDGCQLPFAAGTLSVKTLNESEVVAPTAPEQVFNELAARGYKFHGTISRGTALESLQYRRKVLAVSSNEIPIEKLKTIPDFTPA